MSPWTFEKKTFVNLNVSNSWSKGTQWHVVMSQTRSSSIWWFEKEWGGRGGGMTDTCHKKTEYCRAGTLSYKWLLNDSYSLYTQSNCTSHNINTAGKNRISQLLQKIQKWRKLQLLLHWYLIEWFSTDSWLNDSPLIAEWMILHW